MTNTFALPRRDWPMMSECPSKRSGCETCRFSALWCVRPILQLTGMEFEWGFVNLVGLSGVMSMV